MLVWLPPHSTTWNPTNFSRWRNRWAGGVAPSILRDYLLTHRSQMQKTDQKTKEWTKLHWSTGVQQTDLSHATARWKAAYSGFSFQPAFLPQWCRTPVRQHPKGNSLSGKHWEKNGQGGSPGQGNPARPWKTHKNHLGSSSTHARRFFNLGSSAISAPPLLFVPLFLSPGTQ